MATDLKLPQMEDLGALELVEPVYVSLLPTGATTVMVKYRPEVQVSCILPPREFDIKFTSGRTFERGRVFQNLTVKSPTLIMSCGYGEVPSPRTYQRVTNGYTLWAVDKDRKDAVYVKPYLLANVWEKGVICFGTLHPSSLRQAFNYYWSSTFNDELTKQPTHDRCENKVHGLIWHSGCKCKKQQQHTCACPKETFHKHYGCGCTSVGASKKCKGLCKEKNCLCCASIDLQITKAKAADEKLTDKQALKLVNSAEKVYPGCGCNWRHKRGCNCQRGNCLCPCTCECCTKTCKHTVCVCPCCVKTCDCRCVCSPTQKFQQYISNYHTTLLPSQPWKERTAFFCGEAYWASPKSAEGVLVSNSRNLMARIPKKFWKKDKDGSPMVVALANRQEDDTWKLESGPFSFTLSSKSVVIK